MLYPKLQFITDSLQKTEEACKAGVKWIQFRLKELSQEQWEEQAREFVRICRSYEVVSIINDSPAIALAAGADGLHLGRNDMPVEETRKILADRPMIIGGTANTLEDLQMLCKLNVDYIGLGPFRFTTTKKNLSPMLGVEGYRRLLYDLKEEFQKFPPVYAIGGILPQDVKEILQAGVYGVAVSSAIADGLPHSVESFQRELEELAV
jgi:thiamine-phosphate pyrophosphorylase